MFEKLCVKENLNLSDTKNWSVFSLYCEIWTLTAKLERSFSTLEREDDNSRAKIKILHLQRRKLIDQNPKTKIGLLMKLLKKWRQLLLSICFFQLIFGGFWLAEKLNKYTSLILFLWCFVLQFFLICWTLKSATVDVLFRLFQFRHPNFRRARIQGVKLVILT